MIILLANILLTEIYLMNTNIFITETADIAFINWKLKIYTLNWGILMSYKLGLCSVSFRNNSAEDILESMKKG